MPTLKKRFLFLPLAFGAVASAFSAQVHIYLVGVPGNSSGASAVSAYVAGGDGQPLSPSSYADANYADGEGNQIVRGKFTFTVLDSLLGTPQTLATGRIAFELNGSYTDYLTFANDSSFAYPDATAFSHAALPQLPPATADLTVAGALDVYGDVLDVRGGTFNLGSVLTDTDAPLLSLTALNYYAPEMGAYKGAQIDATVGVHYPTWSWRHLGVNGGVFTSMSLDKDHVVRLFPRNDSSTSETASIVLDPTAGSIQINGNSVLTANGLSSALSAFHPISFAIGSSANATQTGALAAGAESLASGVGSIALGNNTGALADYTMAFGKGAQATQSFDIAIGNNAISTGGSTWWHTPDSGSTAIGPNAEATETASSAFGPHARANASESMALGPIARTAGPASLAIGWSAYSGGNSAVSIGPLAGAWYDLSTAFGPQASAEAVASSAIGPFTVTRGYGQTVVGTANQLVGNQTDALDPTSEVFVVGNGSVTLVPGQGWVASRSNAMTIRRDGQTRFAGALGVGSGTLSGAVFAGMGGLDVAYGGIPATLVLGADNNKSSRTDNVDKTMRIAMPPFNSASYGAAILLGDTLQYNNIISIGGGSSVLNAATDIKLFTAANNTTTTGTKRMSIDSSGNILLGGDDLSAGPGATSQTVAGRLNDTAADQYAGPSGPVAYSHGNGVFVVGAGATAGGTTTRSNALRVRADGVVLVKPAGDLDMGEFKAGEAP